MNLRSVTVHKRNRVFPVPRDIRRIQRSRHALSRLLWCIQLCVSRDNLSIRLQWKIDFCSVLPIWHTIKIYSWIEIIPDKRLIVTEFIFDSDKDYKKFPQEGIFGNVLGLLCILYGGLVVYMATKPEFKRNPKLEYEPLLHSDTTWNRTIAILNTFVL